MTSEEQVVYVQKVIAALPESHNDALTVLMHVVAGYFAEMKFTPRQVMRWVFKITSMLDGKFDKG